MKTKKKRGFGLSPPRKNQNGNQLVFLSVGVDPLNWQSFIEIGEMACSTTARDFVDTLLTAISISSRKRNGRWNACNCA